MLEDREIIALSEAEVWRDPLEEIDYVPSIPPALTRDQDLVWSKISPSIKASSGGKPIPPYVLHGVTGSGKTEIYMRAVHETLGMGRRAILLVPEIALTPQTIRRFLARFPGQVGLSHSQLSAGERYDTWRRCRAGQIDIVIGPRSALFLPVCNVGLIVLDESHDDSYKEQERSPRYHTRNVAVKYSSILGAMCILGSATPDLVTTYRASRGKYHLLEMPRRILGHRERVDGQSERLGIQTNYVAHDGDSSTIDLPPVRVVDMRQELRAGNRSIFSRPLGKALSDVINRDEQAILFLNRRGSSTYVFCRDCGWVASCPRCDNPLIYHRNQDLLTCHHCGHQTAARSECPQCKGSRVRYFGAGTKRIVDEVQSLFPDTRILRWDRDATRQKGAHDVLLANFAAHRADVLVGTQMISKGLDLPLVTLVGVVSADVGLNLPDYRASERVFQILTQVAGRAGRGLLGGQVVLQTYQPEHYVIKAASTHDYHAFYKDEIEYRRDLRYPPFSRMARLIFRATSRDAAESQTGRMANLLKHRIIKDRSQDELIGPTPCFFERIRGEYRWQIIIRGYDPASIIPDELGESWQIDIDPVSLL
jgi:primosomal protein N' (replication factor Y)